MSQRDQKNMIPKRWIRGLAAATVVACCFFSSVHAEELTPRQKVIMNQVLATDGYLNENLHEQFWTDIPPHIKGSSRRLDELRLLFEESFALAIEFQIETWMSVRMSLEAGSIVTSPNYRDVKSRVLSSKVVPAKINKRNIAHAEGLMISAAQKTPFELPQGPIFITPELVSQVLGGLEGSFSRFRRLISPEWAVKLQQRSYDDIGISLLSIDPFNIEHQEVETENGVSVKLVTLTSRLDDLEYLTVTFMEYEPRLVINQERLFSIAKGALNGVGAQPISVIGESWRGLRAVTFSGESSLSDVRVFYSGKVIGLPANKGTLLLQAFGNTSKIEADYSLEKISTNIQLN